MLSRTPPMGFNTWNTFGTEISDSLVREVADAMAEKGYREAGYEYLVIDDGWSEMERDREGKLVPDARKFPHGIRKLADYVHQKGLKFGIYSCAGLKTCAGYPASFDHEYEDARTFAGWGVDFLKYDYCHFPKSADTVTAYQRMSMALKASGREILFSACNWGVQEPQNWMRSIGAHMYRSTGDIFDCYASFRDIALSQVDRLCCSAPGCFNDMDMLTVGMGGKGNVGMGGCTPEEYRMQFALWCLFGTPLMIGGDIRTMDGETEKLLQNRSLLAINQDEECRPPCRISRPDSETQVFLRHLAGNEFALGFFNFSDEERHASFFFADAGIPWSSGCALRLTDCFTGEEGKARDCMDPLLAAHSCRLYRAKLVSGE